jgi:hypothetical protein
MKDWIHLATQWPVVRRALWCVLIVGAILTTINHGAPILRGELTGQRLAQIGLTLLVPYCVSTFSSVSAMRAYADERRSRDES